MGEILKKRLKQNKFSSKQQEALLNIFVCANHLRLKSSTMIEQYGITFGQYNVLRILKGKYPDGHPRCEIISRMIEPAPDVTRLIDKLEKQKFVERFHSSEDRRHSIARITQKGIDLLEKIQAQVEFMDKNLCINLTEKELTELSRILEKIYQDEVE